LKAACGGPKGEALKAPGKIRAVCRGGSGRPWYHARVQPADFAFDLPPELIAQAPLAERSASRLLVLPRVGAMPLAGQLRDLAIRDLPALLRAGDLLVLNDTRVIAARVMGSRPTGGRVEIFLERITGEDAALVQMRASKPIRPGLVVATAGGEAVVLERHDGLWAIRTPGPALAFFEAHGAVPLPPYIQRAAGAMDKERYQSIFARDPGAVAAPTASLHFDDGLIARLDALGVERACITLHVGAGTFQPVRSEQLEQHVLHRERVVVGAGVCEAIARTRARGGRVVAVGTTVVRALEAAALQQAGVDTTAGGGAGLDAALAAARPALRSWSGDTRLFIRPGFQFRVIDGLLTNFHLPQSTLLMLVCAFAGRERVLAAYQHAVRQRYRFFSYGDAMFLTPSTATVHAT